MNRTRRHRSARNHDTGRGLLAATASLAASVLLLAGCTGDPEPPASAKSETPAATAAPEPASAPAAGPDAGERTLGPLAGALEGKNLIVLSWDTLRYDSLGVNGHDGPISPNVDRWAKDALVMDHFYSVSSWTLVTHHSLFTSQFPTVHGVINHTRALPEEKWTMAEMFKAAGYETHAFTGGAYVSPTYGFEQGFDGFRIIGDSKALMMEELVDVATTWFRDRTPDRPFFAFLHSFDVHVPYTPPAEFLEPFLPLPEGTVDPTDPYTLLRMMNGTVPDTPEDVAMLKRLYEAEVRYVDHQLGVLFQRLEEMGIADDTVIVILSDHGESFREHGKNMTHAYTLYEEVVHVPFLIKMPGITDGLGLRRESLGSMVDVLPTLLELMNVPGPEGVTEMQGKSLVPVLERDEPVNEMIFLETDYSNHLDRFPQMFPGRTQTRTRALRTDTWKYIYDPLNGIEELYRADTDPLETQNLLPGAEAEAAPLKATLEKWMTAMESLAHAGSEVEIPEETEEMLRDLGYI